MTTLRTSRTRAAYKRAALYRAIVEGEKPTILKILQHSNVDCNLRDDNGDTVLHLAFHRKDKASRRTIEILKIFLDLGVNVNAKNAIGKTAMHLAVRDKSKGVVAFLISRGGDLNARDERGNSTAHYLVETDFKRFRDCVCNCGSPDDRNLLERECEDFLYWLLRKGLDVECANKAGVSALKLALSRNVQHVLPLFLKYARDVNTVDERNQTILHYFLEKNGYYEDYTRRNETMKIAVPSFFYGPEYCVNVVKILLDRGASVDSVDDDGNTPLHIAGKLEESAVLGMMLEKFTNVNARNRRGDTLLHVVIADCMDSVGLYFDEYVNVVRALIAKGADVHSSNNAGYTLVQLAAMQKHLGILAVLKEHGADLRVLSRQGENLLHLISANMNEMVSDQSYYEMVDLLVSEGCDVNAKDSDDVSPLHVAAKYGSKAVAKKLIERGARVDCRERTHLLTPLHMAAEFDHADVIELLIGAGANVNAKDMSGVTALHRAVRHFTGGSARILLKLGAHVDAQDRYGRSPLDKAIDHDNPDGVQVLLKYGADINDLDSLGAVVFSNNNYMYHILLEHWKSMRAVGVPCTNDFDNYNGEDFKHSRDLFTREIQELKDSTIDSRTSLYDFLRMNRNQKCFYATTNGDIKQLLESPMLELQFPRFHVLILASYRAGLARRLLLEPAKQAWYKITRIDLPNICLELILDNLSNASLRRMVDGDDVNRLKRSFARKASKPTKSRRTE